MAALRPMADPLQLEQGAPQATHWSEQAFALMRRHGVSPIPAHYQIFFSYVSEENIPLRRELDPHLQGNALVDDRVIGRLFHKYFNPSGTDADSAIEHTNQRMQSKLEHVIMQLQAAESDTSRFGNALLGYSDTLADVTDVSHVRNYLDALANETRMMEEKSRKLESELKKSSEEINKLKESLEATRLEAITDELTGIGNRKLFAQTLRNAAATASPDLPLSLILSDVDNFKTFNDTWGHKLGDHVLRLVANLLDTSCGAGGVVTRYGGEEFAIILSDLTLSKALAIAETMRLTIGRKVMKTKATQVNLGRVTLSFGVAQYEIGEDIDDFVSRADRALYAAKAAGRNCVVAG